MATRGIDREARLRRTEVGVGTVTLVVIVAALVAILSGGIGGTDGDTILKARFNHIDGLSVGSDVRIAGVKVGHVTGESIDPASFLATVAFALRSDIRLPVDSSASIVSEGLLGGKYLSIVPGGDRRDLGQGGVITATQGSVGLEALLGTFIGSVTSLMDAVKASGKAGGAAAPAGGSAPGGLGP